MRLQALVLLTLGAAACGGRSSGLATPDNGGRCLDNAATVSLLVTPAFLDRGEAVDVRIAWTVSAELTPPVIATLTTGPDDAIEVEVVLTEEMPVTLSPTYAGTQENPFGLGVAAGAAVALASAGRPQGCDTNPTATASFELR